MSFVAWGLWFQFWLVLLTLWAGILVIGWSYIDRDSPMIHRSTRWWGRSLLKICHIPVEVEGREHLVPGQAYIFAANHRCHFDIFALASVPGPVSLGGEKIPLSDTDFGPGHVPHGLGLDGPGQPTIRGQEP